MATSAPTGLQPEEIVDVARRLISEHGLAWFSMRKLAAALGVNPMTVYLRFDSKDELLDAVARRGLADALYTGRTRSYEGTPEGWPLYRSPRVGKRCTCNLARQAIGRT